MIFKKMIILLFLCLIVSCKIHSFKENNYITLSKCISVKQIISDIEKNNPKKFTILSSTIFKYRFHSITGLGVIKCDREVNHFHTAVLAPNGGIKIFELKYDKGKFEQLYVMDEFAKYDNFTNTVGSDIKNIYMDITPEIYDSFKIKDNKIVFYIKKGEKDIKYIVAGRDMRLYQKIISENNEIETIISYYEYKNFNGIFFPQGIVLENKKYGYSLISSLKELKYE